jgi:uncharacterized protein
MASVEMPITVSVVCSPQTGEVRECVLSLLEGALLQDGLDAALAGGLLGEGFWMAPDTAVGIWGRICERSTLLRDHDRVEVYRPLLLDPKTARRLRAPPSPRRKK